MYDQHQVAEEPCDARSVKHGFGAEQGWRHPCLGRQTRRLTSSKTDSSFGSHVCHGVHKISNKGEGQDSSGGSVRASLQVDQNHLEVLADENKLRRSEVGRMPAQERIEVGRRVGERSGLKKRISLTRHPQIACSMPSLATDRFCFSRTLRVYSGIKPR